MTGDGNPAGSAGSTTGTSPGLGSRSCGQRTHQPSPAARRRCPGSCVTSPATIPGGATAVLAPIAERVLSRTVTYLPRLAGGWDDLFQHGMAVALPEARALSPTPGESLDDFAVRLERRVAMAVRHRLIDLIRRQDAADRNTASVSIEEVRERGVEETGNEGDPFDLVFQPHLSARRDARARAIALAVYRQSTGLARRIIRRAYLTAFVGRRTPGTLELRAHPGYPAAAQALATAWAGGLAQAMAGALTPVYDRPRASRRARRSLTGAA